MLNSQKVRAMAPEMDSLRMGMGWSKKDLEKIQIIVESTYGKSHPGSAHLNILVKEAMEELYKIGVKPADYYATDICDGQAQGHDGMNYSLVSREIIADLIEIHVNATSFDGGLFITSCDKGMPANLVAMARVNIPSIAIPGGVMASGPDLLTLNQIGTYSAMLKRGEITDEKYGFYKENACPSCGACSFMGTAATMQVMSEALGLALPGAALLPANSDILKLFAKASAKALVNLVHKGIKVSDIVTKEALENAIIVHAAIGGSTNAMLHIPAIAKELGIEITAEDFDRIHRNIPFLLNLRPSGTWPAEYLFYSGGVPAVMKKLKPYLNLEVMTVTGKTLGENLEAFNPGEAYGHYYKAKQGFDPNQVIFDIENPISKSGSVSVLKGNLAPEGCVIKHSALPKSMWDITLKARVFDREEDAFEAVITRDIKPGDAVIIRYEGPRGSGMPEMFYTTEAVASDESLNSTVALITDGRFSGATRGPAIGHVSPEGASGGPIALVEDGDLININIDHRSINIVGIKGEEKTPQEVLACLESRREKLIPRAPRFKGGVLGMYTKLANSAIKGGYIED